MYCNPASSERNACRTARSVLDGQLAFCDSNIATSSPFEEYRIQRRSRRCRARSCLDVTAIAHHGTSKIRPRRAFHCFCQMIQKIFMHPTQQWISFWSDRSQSGCGSDDASKRNESRNASRIVSIRVQRRSKSNASRSSFRVSEPNVCNHEVRTEDHPLLESTIRSHHPRCRHLPEASTHTLMSQRKWNGFLHEPFLTSRKLYDEHVLVIVVLSESPILSSGVTYMFGMRIPVSSKGLAGETDSILTLEPNTPVRDRTKVAPSRSVLLHLCTVSLHHGRTFIRRTLHLCHTCLGTASQLCSWLDSELESSPPDWTDSSFFS